MSGIDQRKKCVERPSWRLLTDSSHEGFLLFSVLVFTHLRFPETKSL